MTVGSVTMRHSDNVVRRDISKHCVMHIPARIRVGNVTPDVSRKTNVANTNDVCDVSAQHSIRTFSGLRNLYYKTQRF